MAKENGDGPTEQAAFEGNGGRVARLGGEGWDRFVVTWYHTGAGTEHEAAVARDKYQLIIGIDIKATNLLVVRPRSGEVQHVRASQKLSAVKAVQSEDAGYRGAELKIAVVQPTRVGCTTTIGAV